MYIHVHINIYIYTYEVCVCIHVLYGLPIHVCTSIYLTGDSMRNCTYNTGSELTMSWSRGSDQKPMNFPSGTQRGFLIEDSCHNSSRNGKFKVIKVWEIV